MMKKLLKAPYTGKIEIGNISISCAVLEDGTRIISERGFSKALGAKRGGSHWKRKRGKTDGADLPVYVSANNLIPFIDSELMAALNDRIEYAGPRGGRASGIKAEFIPQICNVYLKARDADALLASQEHLAKQADIIMRGLAHIGIIALVDEATGYQEVRDRHALEEILERWIAKELLPWTKRFPDEFYRLIFKLNNWPYDPASVKRSQVIGHYTNNIVYDRLEAGVLKELQEKNPPTETGSGRKDKHHQWFTDFGNDKLRDHLNGVIALMRAASNWRNFQRMLNRAYPKKGQTLELPLDED